MIYVFLVEYKYLLVNMLLFMQIGPFHGFNSERTRVKVKIQLDLHGIVSVVSARVSEKLRNLILTYINFVITNTF